MEYSRLLLALKRFSFEEKMRIAQTFSRQTFTSAGVVDIGTLREMPLPWELETFTLFAIKAVEWKSDNFCGKNGRKFEQMIDCIRNECPPIMETAEGDAFTTWFLTVTAAVQFEIQEYYPFKLFRFNYLFSFINDKINMPQIFRGKFGCDYYEYSLLGYVLWLGFSTKDFTQEKFTAIIQHFATPVSHLIISRRAYIEELDVITTDPVNYLYCLRPSYSYPFVEYDGVSYCPLPHLLRRATTSALMHRLTDGDSVLMELIGKEVYENYLFTIINESNIFDEVKSEQEYTLRKMPRRTADVMARKGNTYVFFDSKSFTPKIAIRTFSQDALDKDIERLADSCAQIYKHIRKRFPVEYCYFDSKPNSPLDNIFGLVIVQENPYIRSHAIYEKAAELLKITTESPEYVWLYTHVGLASIHSVEKYCFSGTDMCTSLHDTCNEGKMSHAWLNGNTNPGITYNRYKEFIGNVRQNIISTYRVLQCHPKEQTPDHV